MKSYAFSFPWSTVSGACFGCGFYTTRLVCSAYFSLLLISDSIPLWRFLRVRTRTRFFHFVTHVLFLLSRDDRIVKNAIILNCQDIYHKRIHGKTKCNPIRYYSCKWRFRLSSFPHNRHTLILDLDETLVYSCRFSDLATMVPSLECIGITIVAAELLCEA